MKILKEFGIIFLCLFLGSMTKDLINFPIPETVYGMFYLFVALITKIVKVKDVEKVSNSLLENLSFLLIPPSVAFINVYPILKKDLGKFFILIGISTIITMVVTAYVVKFLQRMVKSNE